MTKIKIFYGSTMGNTVAVAQKIQQQLGQENADSIDIANASADDIQKYDRLIFGTSTWGEGELQGDWDTFLPELDKINFNGKKVALFGLGDQDGYPGTFVNGIGTIYERIIKKGAHIVGFWPADDYNFEKSTAVKDGLFVGLVIDEDNEFNKTDERINKWVTQIKNEMLS
jgi:flavodoxin I